MPTIHIDHQPIQAPDGATILEAAARLGITIPTLCHDRRFKPTGSCMVCAVRRHGAAQFIPACATRVEEGMDIEASTPEVNDFRRAALELLLSDHLGECVAMCRRACPADLDVSRLMTLVERGDDAAAFALLTEHIALPGIVGHLCHRPCEKVCRRAAHDAPVSIRAIERCLAAAEYPPPTAAQSQQIPHSSPIAIVGAGVTGLSAAWHLARRGYTCHVYEAADVPLTSLADADLPPIVIQRDLDRVLQAGVQLHLNERVGDVLPGDVAAILLATGPGQSPPAAVPPVFRAGRCVKPDASLIDRVAAGRRAAHDIHHVLTGAEPDPIPAFRSVLRRLDNAEMLDFIANLNPDPPVDTDFLASESLQREAARCGHCECDIAADCQLRRWSGQLHVRQRRHPASNARYQKRLDLPHLVFEPGKCILCGHCVRVAAEAPAPMQLTLANRGFSTTLTCASADTTDPALRDTAAACVAICPTAALRLRCS